VLLAADDGRQDRRPQRAHPPKYGGRREQHQFAEQNEQIGLDCPDARSRALDSLQRFPMIRCPDKAWARKTGLANHRSSLAANGRLRNASPAESDARIREYCDRCRDWVALRGDRETWRSSTRRRGPCKARSIREVARHCHCRRGSPTASARGFCSRRTHDHLHPPPIKDQNRHPQKRGSPIVATIPDGSKP
jgi:hypothetical protein